MNVLPTPFRGPLTIVQIAAGMNAATVNAARLASDARLLFSNGRWPSAASLAVLSIEESGKLVILRRFLLASEEQIKSLWKDYRSHTKKNLNCIVPDLVAEGARKLEDFLPIVDKTSDHPQMLDTVKQLGFYSDCLGKGYWSLPDEFVDEELASQWVRTAEILSPGREITVRELELWVKHMKPVWKKDSEGTKTALANWYGEMQAEGLMPAGPNQMEAFMRVGLNITQANQLDANQKT